MRSRVNNDGHIIGVTQVLNKRGGPFTPEDEQRLKAFTAQVSIALQNAKLFDDVQNMRNYSEAMLASMSNGVITLDMAGTVATCNDAGGRILGTDASSLVGSHYSEVFGSAEQIIGAMVARVADDAIRKPEMAMDVDIQRLATEGTGAASAVVSANANVLPLIGGIGEHLGTMVVMEDISGEKRVRSTMARYMDPALADELVRGDEDILGGRSVEASVLFSDVRSFTSLAEELGPQATVTLLNDYFTIMVECIQEQGGHARQVHRRRHHGGVRSSGRPRRRRRPRCAVRDRHDLVALRVERGAGAGRASSDRHGYRHQHRDRGRWAISGAQSAWTSP